MPTGLFPRHSSLVKVVSYLQPLETINVSPQRQTDNKTDILIKTDSTHSSLSRSWVTFDLSDGRASAVRDAINEDFVCVCLCLWVCVGAAGGRCVCACSVEGSDSNPKQHKLSACGRFPPPTLRECVCVCVPRSLEEQWSARSSAKPHRNFPLSFRFLSSVVRTDSFELMYNLLPEPRRRTRRSLNESCRCLGDVESVKRHLMMMIQQVVVPGFVVFQSGCQIISTVWCHYFKRRKLTAASLHNPHKRHV